MQYSSDLLEQARSLASADPNKPKQANLRRAVSAAYYALFHELVDRCVATILTKEQADGPLGRRLSRLFDHGNLLRASKWFESPSQQPGPIQELYAEQPTDLSLSTVCKAFQSLQSQRHIADYDRFQTFARQETLRLIQDATLAHLEIPKAAASPHWVPFAWYCLLGERIKSNS